MDLIIRKIPQISTREWLEPVRTEGLHTIVETQIGNFSLYRKPARRDTAEAKAGSWEEWIFTLDSRVVMKIRDAATPWTSLHKRMRAGIHGEVDGMTFQAYAKRAIAPSKRAVCFTFDDHSLLFSTEGLLKTFHREDSDGRHLIAKTHRGRWQGQELPASSAVIICFFVTAGLDVFLESPLWDIPPF